MTDNLPQHIRFFLTLLIVLLGFALPGAPIAAAQETEFKLTVNGRPISGMYLVPQKRGRDLFLPAAAIATMLGDQLRIDQGLETVQLVRQNGTSAEFDARTNQVRENGSVILSLQNSDRMTLPPLEIFLLLPTEIIIALFDVSVYVDSASREIRVRRGQPVERNIIISEEKQKGTVVHQADYDYGLNRYNSTTGQNLTLNLKATVGANKISLLVNNSSSGSANPIWQPKSGTLIVSRPGGQQFTAGNFSTGSTLVFLQLPVQGTDFSGPIFGRRVSIFGGKSYSKWSGPLFDLTGGFPDRARRTYAAGATMNLEKFDPDSRSVNDSETSIGAVVFSRKYAGTGLLLSGGSRISRKRSQLRINLATSAVSSEMAAGKSGNVGFAADFSGSFRLSKQFGLHGHLVKVSQYYEPLQTFRHYPQTSFGGGVSLRPVSWLSASLNANQTTRTGITEAFTRSILGSVNIAPRDRRLPTVYVSHLVTSSNLFRPAQVTNINVTKDFARWQLFSNYSRVKFNDRAISIVQTGARIRDIFGGYLQASQSFGSSGVYGSNLEWRTGGIFEKRLGFSAAVGYMRNKTGAIYLNKRISTMLRLPRRNTLQIDYLQTPNGPQFSINFRGSLFRRSSAGDFYLASGSRPRPVSTISGRVFQDLNENGEFDLGIDKPQQEVRLRTVAGQTAVTDIFGIYTIRDVPTGENKILIDQQTVRADLTIIGEPEKDLVLLSNRLARVDFRLVNTGQLSGTVWLDENQNGQYEEGEALLADVRIIAGNNQDTLTDSLGTFTIGDLAPGDYVIFIDDKTLPPNLKSVATTIAVRVQAGKRTSEVLVPVMQKPPIVKSF